jgi:hypothetical protein
MLDYSICGRVFIWLKENITWVFSGIGVFGLGLIIFYIGDTATDSAPDSVVIKDQRGGTSIGYVQNGATVHINQGTGISGEEMKQVVQSLAPSVTEENEGASARPDIQPPIVIYDPFMVENRAH